MSNRDWQKKVTAKADLIEHKIIRVYQMMEVIYEKSNSIDSALIESVSNIVVNGVESDEEQKDVTEIKKKIMELVDSIIKGDIPKSNKIEWEIMQCTVDNQKALRKSGDITGYRKKVEELQDVATRLSEQIMSLKQEKETELRIQKEELEQKKKSELTKQKEQMTAEKNKEIEDAFKMYKPMLCTMLKCRSMDSLKKVIFSDDIDDFENLSISGIIQFSNYVGQGNMFAVAIRKQLKDYKEGNAWNEVLTENEIAFIGEINKYYQTVDHSFEEINILDCLGIDNTDSVGFKRKYMQSFDGNTDLYEATSIFVPALIEPGKTDGAKQRAIVKGN